MRAQESSISEHTYESTQEHTYESTDESTMGAHIGEDIHEST